MIKFICYSKCTTCQKAKRWLDDNKIEYELRDIKADNPSLEELTTWYIMSGLPLKKFFNTSGLLYKSMELKDKLSTMSEEEQLKLLAADGMLVKRPLVIGEDFVLVGFKESEWSEKAMRKNFGTKAILYPMPVLIIGTYDENWKPNAMNAAWGGISEETQISICVDDGHKTAKNVVKTGAFTVSIADAENVVACDYIGIVSGNKDPDKIEKAGWHATKSEFVDAPLFDELPMALECKLISYDEETCRLMGEIVNVCADERILDKNGKIDLNKFSPITYDPVHHTYRKLGDVVGKAFNDGKKLM